VTYFKPGRGQQTDSTESGRQLMAKIGCTTCHVPDLTLARDRRVADVETAFDPMRGHNPSKIE
jgi:hypothetical protein